eukprot:1821868-Prymnesium_polylepis.3
MQGAGARRSLTDEDSPPAHHRPLRRALSAETGALYPISPFCQLPAEGALQSPSQHNGSLSLSAVAGTDSQWPGSMPRWIRIAAVRVPPRHEPRFV